MHIHPRVCAHCGRMTGDYEGGYASVDGMAVCHPNASERPDCYHMITVYQHRVVRCTRCQQDPYEPLTPVEQHDAMLNTLRQLEAMVQDVTP